MGCPSACPHGRGAGLSETRPQIVVGIVVRKDRDAARAQVSRLESDITHASRDWERVRTASEWETQLRQEMK